MLLVLLVLSQKHKLRGGRCFIISLIKKMFFCKVSGFMTLALPCILVLVGYRVVCGVVSDKLDLFEVKKCDVRSLRRRGAVVFSRQVAHPR